MRATLSDCNYINAKKILTGSYYLILSNNYRKFPICDFKEDGSFSEEELWAVCFIKEGIDLRAIYNYAPWILATM